jgi:hypothetical protein
MKDLLTKIDLLCAALDEFAQDQAKKGRSLNALQGVLNDIGYRIRVNLESSKHLIKQYEKNYEFAFPLALILRSAISDILTFCYAIRFYDFEIDEKNQASLVNELNIFDKDFLSGLFLAVEKENEMKNFIPEIDQRKTAEETRAMINDLKVKLNHLFIGKDFKSAKAIRHSSLNKFFRNSKDREKPNGMMSETYKYDRIMEDKYFANFAMIMSVFKYYSAFHHYSRLSNELLKDQKRNLYYLFLTIDLIFMTYIIYVQLFEKEDQQWLEKLKKIKKEFEDVVKASPI